MRRFNSSLTITLLGRPKLLRQFLGLIIVMCFFSDAMAKPSSRRVATESEVFDLIAAIRDKKMESVKELLDSGFTPEHRIPNEEPVLFTAIESPDPLIFSGDTNEPRANKDILKLLIKAGANVNGKNAKGQSCLDFALEVGNVDAIELIQDLIEPRRRFSRKSTLDLFKGLVAAKESTRDIELAIRNGAVINAHAVGLGDTIKHERHGNTIDKGTPLQIAIFFDRPKTVGILLEAGADFLGRKPSSEPYCVGEPKTEGVQYGALDAASMGSVEIFQLFQKAGLKPNSTFCVAEKITSPLHLAVEKQREAMVAYLLSHGWDPNLNLGSYADDWYGTPLDVAERNENKKIVKLLMDAGGRRKVDQEPKKGEKKKKVLKK